MWKRPEDLNAHFEARGPQEKFDPFAEVNSVLVTAEEMIADGDDLVLRMWSVTARLKRDAVIAWRTMPTDRESHLPLYQLRIKRGTHVLLQKAVVLDVPPPGMDGMDMSIWDGTPPKQMRPRPDHEHKHDHHGHEEKRGCGGHGGCHNREGRGHHHHHHGEHGHGEHGHGEHHHGEHGHHGHEHSGHEHHAHVHHHPGMMHHHPHGHGYPPPPPPPPPSGQPLDRRPGDPGPDGHR